MKNSTLRTGIPLIALTVLGMGSLSAATVSHWRFEEDSGFLQDSSGNGHHLVQNGSVSQVPTAFLNPLPATGDDNEGMASLNGGSFSVTDGGAINISESFTIEMFLHQTSREANSRLAGQNVNGLSGGRGWVLGLAGPSGTSFGSIDGEMYLQLSGDGNDFKNYRLQGVVLDVMTDYYIALSFDESVQEGGVSLLVRNLETGDAYSLTYDHTVSDLYDTNVNLEIGVGFNGFVDEIRLSDVALSQSELLIIPEPSTTMLAGGLAVLLTGVRRRQRCA